ncbi:MAG: ABC transporter substrate-binding protein [Acidobacteriota bacterium]
MARRSRATVTAERTARLAAIRRRRLLQMLALTVAGCGRAADRASHHASTLTIAYSSGAETLVPDATAAERLIFLPLLARNAHGELEGRLAERWEHSADHREWTYSLRPGIRWHDGVPVTAHDVAFSLELFTHPDVGIAGPDWFESIIVHDDRTITVRCRVAARRYNVDVVHYPKHRLQHLDRATLTQWDFWTNPIGNGPYRFVRYIPETMMEFEANPDYYRGRPRIERVVLKFAKEAALTDLMSGAVDAIPEANPAQLPRLAGDPRFRVYHRFGGPSSWAIFWNLNLPLFRDVRVRRALTLTIDREELRQTVNIAPEIPIVDGPFLLDQLRRGDVPAAGRTDPDEARRLLEDAGWRDDDGDGLRERDGQVFRFTAAVISLSPVWEMAVYVQARLRRIGVDMRIQRMENATVRALVPSGRFEAAVSFLSNGELRSQFGPPFPTGYRNSELVALIDRVESTADPAVEAEAIRRIAEIFRDDVPATFLIPGNRAIVAHRRLRGLSSPWRADPLPSMEELWIEE